MWTVAENLMGENSQGNILIEEGRIGVFRLGASILHDAEYEKLLKVMSHFLIVHAEHLFYLDAMSYVAYSPLFWVTDEGDQIPEYDIWVDVTKGDVTVEVTRQG